MSPKALIPPLVKDKNANISRGLSYRIYYPIGDYPIGDYPRGLSELFLGFKAVQYLENNSTRMWKNSACKIHLFIFTLVQKSHQLL